MKKIIYIYIGLISMLVLVTASCQDLNDYEPLYALDADTAINNESTAELALTGVYAGFRLRSSASPFPMMYLIPDIFSGYSSSGPSAGFAPETLGWNTNNPLATGTTDTRNIYTGLYDLINRSNWLIEKVEQLDDKAFKTPVRRVQILAEAKILRAMGHFYLLRNFGQFYDINSEFGIYIRTSPVRNAVVFPRNTVAETYAAILKDLDQGIAGAPENRGKNYTNKIFAKGLKARVLLYTGDYSGSAALCKDIINNSGPAFKLETTYGAIFDQHDSPAIYNSSEVLFGSSGEPNASLGMGSYYSGFVVVNQKYKDAVNGTMVVGGQSIIYDAARVSLFFLNPQGGFYTTKYISSFTAGNYEMVYHMRMAEVYLILAEASARANNAVTSEALESLNTIRTRAGATSTGANGFETYPGSITLDQFLTAVRYEKLAELYAEGGENWYDLVRYDYLDGFGVGFQVSSVKPTATNSDKFILPIPTESIDAGEKVIKQNPSY